LRCVLTNEGYEAGAEVGEEATLGVTRVRAAEEVDRLDEEDGPEALVPVAAGVGVSRYRASIDDSTRVHAAAKLTEIGDPRGARLLAKLTFDTTLNITDRWCAIEAFLANGERSLCLLDADALYAVARDKTDGRRRGSGRGS
jgi:hypothetical protein